MVRSIPGASSGVPIIPLTLSTCIQKDAHHRRRWTVRTYAMYAFGSGLVCTLILAGVGQLGVLQEDSRPPVTVKRASVVDGGSSVGALPGKARTATGQEQEWWIETLSVKPRIFHIHNLLTTTECNHLIKLGVKKGLETALITPYGTHELVQSTTRTNTQAWLDFQQDGVVANLEAKLAAITKTEPDFGENLQILHYNKTQQFKEHHDYFDPATDPPQNFEKGGNRLVTILVYLRGAEVGGETHFTKIDQKLTAQTGDAIMFYNLYPACDGTNKDCVDKATAHAGLPPIVGEKWVATKWIHERRYQDRDEIECTDRHDECAGWAARKPSECEVNRDWMLLNCRRSCTQCDSSGGAPKEGGWGGAGDAEDADDWADPQ